MQTREAPDFWGLHKNKNCAFPLNKNASFQSRNFIKKTLQHRCFPVNTVKYLRTPVLKNIFEWLFERFPTGVNNITSSTGIEEDIFSKVKPKKPFKIQLDEKNLPFHDALDHFFFFHISTPCVRRCLPYKIKDGSGDGLSISLTNEGLILGQWKIIHLCCPFGTLLGF